MRKAIAKTFGYEGRLWVAYYYMISWWYFSVGIHFDFKSPNIEIHLPFGFIRIGRRSDAWLGL